MSNLIAWITANRLTAGLIAIVLLVLVGGGYLFKSQTVDSQISQEDLPEVDIAFDAEGPYAILSPRRDGNALVLNIKRVASYDSITYELAYTAEGIDRGVVGELDTKQKKGEYEQEILFGTCSKNVCKYDKGVENGTLTLHIKKGNRASRMLIQWHLQNPAVALGKLTSADNHFFYTIESNNPDLAQVNYTISNELTGVPKLPDGKVVTGKVYSLNPPLAKALPQGKVMIELAEAPKGQAQIYRYDEDKNAWAGLNTQANGSSFTAPTDKGGIFAVLTSK